MKLITTALAAAVVVAAGVVPAAAALSTGDRAQQAALPVPTTATVTADQLGPDSTVAVITHGDFVHRSNDELGRSLEVISADGVRHPVYSVELRESRGGWYRGDFLIADWRPELRTALLRVSLGADGDKLVSYDVTTGVMREVASPRRASTVALDPDGSGVLMTTYPSEYRSGRVATLSWAGVKTWLPARSDGAAITSIDGRTLVSNEGSERQWWVTDLETRTSTSIDTPGECQPVRWADPDSVIASCSNRRGSQLRRVDLDGRSTRLGIRHTQRTRSTGPAVFSDGDVRVVRDRSWFESYSGCGGAFLTRQTPAGKVRRVRVPGLEGVLSLVGARGDDLVITHEVGDCDPARTRAVMTLFDPVTKDESVLTRLSRDEQWREVVPAAEVRSWIW